jgi:hypothetical protein
MPKWKEGDRVRVISRTVTEEDRKKNRYFEHMAGLVGSVQNVYADSQVAVRVDPESMTKVTAEVHKAATQRMRDRFAKDTSEEQKKQLTKEEMEFNANYVVLVQQTDLEGA